MESLPLSLDPVIPTNFDFDSFFLMFVFPSPGQRNFNKRVTMTPLYSLGRADYQLIQAIYLEQISRAWEKSGVAQAAKSKATASKTNTPSNLNRGNDENRRRCIKDKLSQQQLNGRPQNRLKSPISKLPWELILDIVEYLDPVETTCFSLTSKLYYSLNRSLNPDAVDLGEIGRIRTGLLSGCIVELEGRTLHEAIGEWMKTGSWIYSHGRCIFVKKGK